MLTALPYGELLASRLRYVQNDRGSMSAREVPPPSNVTPLAERRRMFARMPVALTPLVGREQELALASALLRREDVRLLSIVGPGGIGKTRLAVEIARAEADSFSQGVAFIPLSAVAEHTHVSSAIRQALGVPEDVGTDDREGLIQALRNATALLVLDNFEHVLDAAPLLTELLASCEQLKIVVTSRALLRLTGEYALPVPPLGLPDRAAVHSLEQMSQSPAVRLFVDRVRAVNPAFVLSGKTSLLVADICQHLDGLPLAIELAAAQAAVLPLSALRDRIRARLPLPVIGPRDAPARLRTINDAVAWSYDLLSDDEKRLFRRMSVFAGSFALDAAEQVTAASAAVSNAESGVHGSVPATTLEGLSSLVEKSLLRREGRDGDLRFAMLETIRAFAWDQLVASGEADLISDAHAAWVLELAERHALAVVMPDGERALRRLEIDHPNLLAALNWFDRRGNDDGLLRLTAVLGGFWAAFYHYREGRSWLERALARIPADSSAARGRAEVSLGRILAEIGEADRAERTLAAGVGRLDPEGDAVWIASALIRRASLANQLGEHDRAERFLNQAVADTAGIYDTVISAAITGVILANLGVAAHGRGDFALATERYEASLRVCRELGYTLGVIRSLRDLGDIERDRGNFASSLSHYQEALELFGDQADLRIVVDALGGAALAAAAWRQPARAARFIGAAEKFRSLHGGEFLVPTDWSAHARATAAIHTAPTEPEIEAAWAEGQRLTVAEAIAEIHALAPAEESAEQIALSPVNLTAREMDVLRLLVAGLPDRTIADTLFLSVRTVEAHVARIFTKLEVRTRTAAARAALVAGLVDANQLRD
jgi:predicted ATPase/DNA-binding CsgD family transcriptional regulator